MSTKQEAYLLSLINRATGKRYRYLSQVEEDGIGRMVKRVRGMSVAEASDLIDEWKER